MTTAVLTPPATVFPPAAPPQPPPKSSGYQLWRCSPAQFYQMAELNVFADRRVELLNGVVVAMPVPSNLHGLGVGLLQGAIQSAFGDEYWARNQCFLDLLPHSVPGPDIAVVAGNIRTQIGRRDNPTAAILVAEVSDSTLREDRTYKGSFYAAAGVPEYWILNIPDNVLEVFRDPLPDASADFGFSYGTRLTFRAGDTVAPLAAPHAAIAVADVLPG